MYPAAPLCKLIMHTVERPFFRDSSVDLPTTIRHPGTRRRCLCSNPCPSRDPAARPRSSTWTRRSSPSRARWRSAARSTPGGLINRRAVLRSAYAQFVYLVGGADHDQMERMRALPAPRWRPAGTCSRSRTSSTETLHELIDPIIYDEAATLIEEHHLAGRDVVIVSTSGAEVVEPIGEMLGADHVIATRMVVEDGRYSGEIEYYAYGETKADAVRELAEREGYDLARCYAYSDSVTDLPMLEAVGHPYAVNPDRALRREATPRDWPVLVFNKPVKLRDRIGNVSPAGPPGPRGRGTGRRRGNRGHRLARPHGVAAATRPGGRGRAPDGCSSAWRIPMRSGA